MQLEAKYGPQPTDKEALLHQIIYKLREVSVTSVYFHGTVLLPLQVQGNNDMDGANFRAVLYFFLCTDGSELAQKVTTFLKQFQCVLILHVFIIGNCEGTKDNN